jgi:hypothetical protein
VDLSEVRFGVCGYVVADDVDADDDVEVGFTDVVDVDTPYFLCHKPA